MGTIFRSGPPRPQSRTRRHQAASRDRLEALTCYLSASSTDSLKHKSTSSTTDCEKLLQSNLPLVTPLPQKGALLTTHTLFPHPALHTSVRSTLTLSTLQRIIRVNRHLFSTCPLGPSAHRLGLHPRRMAKSLGFFINFPQTQTRRRLPNEKRFNR